MRGSRLSNVQNFLARKGMTVEDAIRLLTDAAELVKAIEDDVVEGRITIGYQIRTLVTIQNVLCYLAHFFPRFVRPKWAKAYTR